MDINNVVSQMININNLIDKGSFDSAYKYVRGILNDIDKINTVDISRIKILSNLAGYLIDIGSFSHKKEVAEEGLNIFINNKEVFLSIMTSSSYYYNLANGMNAVVNFNFRGDNDIDSFIQLNEVKNNYWKAYKYSLEDGEVHPELMVNLANTLKRQYRISESIDYYEQAIAIDGSIPQAWVNRSEALELLNDLSTTYSYKMIQEIIRGYECAINTDKCIPSWVTSYRQKIKYSEGILEDLSIGDKHDAVIDERLTREEYEALSQYQRFCLDNNLMLSEHSLYCNCYAASKDNITITTTGEGVFGDFIIPMEMVLNRLKAEYSLARKMFFEYKIGSEVFDEESEVYYSELYNDEILYENIEKLRMSFRSCFGILDKIAVALCKLFELKPNRGHIYFHSFWQISDDKRKEKINKIKNKALLGLLSIAMDLNNKNGELSFFREWRNDLEHKLLVIHEKDMFLDLYDSYGFFDDVKFIEKEDFEQHLLQLIKIVKSAIILFTFTIRIEGKRNIPDRALTVANHIERKIL
ncbi:LA2681 family HEPN domain-containing protein [Cronobacter turicensis]|uniref:LA2681 family HEPN domain-containing protein n=1 Tax=Cronobacter dublinensis TaxID=413497 RepID=UPI001375CEB7|nr:LA2681 family HEPN domain-containing protein [Cronobacter dublinensis]NCH71184.1 tetratricopeptide repeat protein [Cronobacter dublinensis]